MDYSPNIYGQQNQQQQQDPLDKLNEVAQLVRLRNAVRPLPQTTATMDDIASRPYGGDDGH